jgi:parallel beta-helix repeat protein
LLAAAVLCACTHPFAPQPTETAPAGLASPNGAPDAAEIHNVAGACPGLPPEQDAPAATPVVDDAQTEDRVEPEPQQPDTSDENASMSTSYDAATNSILLNASVPTTLPEVAQELGRPDLLRQVSPGEWLLRANLRVGKQAVLQIAGPDVRWLKLRSDRQGFVWLKAFGGNLSFIDTCVTSWDVGRHNVDVDDVDGRSFVLARDGARMAIRDSELSYLGYFANESYGVAWRQPGTSGEAINSRFGHNFYGLYSYEVSSLQIRNNEVHHSIRYGIDPHSRSNELLIEGNISHHNGKHGIILAEECSGSTVRGNIVYGNKLHGIVIYQHSNGNLIAGNTSYSNGSQGININDASDNVIRDNLIYENVQVGIGIGQGSTNSLVVGNVVRDNHTDGISLYSGATGNIVRQNGVHGNARYGIYIKSPNNQIDAGNQVFDNQIGIFLNTSVMPTVSLEDNQVYGNRDANMRTGSD